MTPRLAAFLALLLAAPALAGCIAADEAGPEATPSDLPETGADPADRLLATHSTAWVHSDASSSQVKTLDAPVPADAAAVFVRANWSLATHATIEVAVVAPDGERHVLGTGSGAQGDDTALGVVPARQGTWTLEARVDGSGAGTLEASPVAPGPDLAPAEPQGPSRPVVAVVDTGVNPYHQAFRAPGLATEDLPERIREAAGPQPLSVPLAPGDSYHASVRRDAPVWDQVPPGRVVHFEGTRVLGYNLGDEPGPDLPVLDRSGHGTMTADAVLEGHPDALVLMVTGGDYDAGVRWAADQPWIDLQSLSWGPVVNAAGAAEPQAFGFTTAEATQEAWKAGQLVFSATGNDPTHAVTDTTSGPPWVHSVSGSQPDTKGRAFMSGNGVDTVANWTQTLARHDSLSENATASGTSFATPRTAGVAAAILGQARQAGADVGPAELRAALNRTAVYWDAADYGGPTDPGPSVPVAPAAPWVSMGWGHVDRRVVDEAVQGLLEGELPDKPDAAEAYMDAQLEARERYWNAR